MKGAHQTQRPLEKEHLARGHHGMFYSLKTMAQCALPSGQPSLGGGEGGQGGQYLMEVSQVKAQLREMWE